MTFVGHLEVLVAISNVCVYVRGVMLTVARVFRSYKTTSRDIALECRRSSTCVTFCLVTAMRVQRLLRRLLSTLHARVSRDVGRTFVTCVCRENKS